MDSIYLPAEIKIEYMSKLDSKSLRNLYSVNREYNKLCKKSGIWKKFCKRDFPKEYQALKYLNEPDWMRVYHWFQRKNGFEQKFIFDVRGYPVRDSKNVLFSFYYESGYKVYSNLSRSLRAIIGVLISLGGHVNEAEEFCLDGIYLDMYRFCIVYYAFDDMIWIFTEIPLSSKLYNKCINELRTYIEMIEPPVYNLAKKGYLFEWDKIDILFKRDIPNYGYYDPYEYLYISEFTKNVEVMTNQMKDDYIREILLSNDPICVVSGINEQQANEIFNIVDPWRDRGEPNMAKFGVYYGTPFYIRYMDKSIKVYCPTRNIKALIKDLTDIFKMVI